MWNFFLPRRRYHDQNGTEQTYFRSNVDAQNWAACQRVWDGLTEQEREIQYTVYCTDYSRTPDAIRTYAERHSMTDRDVWRVSYAIGKRLAVERGLEPDRSEECNQVHKGKQSE